MAPRNSECAEFQRSRKCRFVKHTNTDFISDFISAEQSCLVTQKYCFFSVKPNACSSFTAESDLCPLKEGSKRKVEPIKKLLHFSNPCKGEVSVS